MNNEIILRESGNTYIGEIANHAVGTPLPPIMKLDCTERYHVFEWQYGAWILRASQSTKELAERYRGPNRVLAYRDESPEDYGAPAGSVEVPCKHPLEIRRFLTPNGSHFVKLTDESESTWEAYCADLVSKSIVARGSNRDLRNAALA